MAGIRISVFECIFLTVETKKNSINSNVFENFINKIILLFYFVSKHFYVLLLNKLKLTLISFMQMHKMSRKLILLKEAIEIIGYTLYTY